MYNNGNLETVSQLSPEKAMNKAVEKAIISLLQTDFWPAESSETTAEKIIDLLVHDTYRECKTGCLSAIYHLIPYQDLFNHVFLMAADEISGKPETKFKKGYDYFHFFALAQGVNSVWYAVSPANFDPKIEKSTITKVLQSPSLTGLLEIIETEEGGVWPTADEIENCLDNTLKPIITANKGRENLHIHAFSKYETKLHSHPTHWNVFHDHCGSIRFYQESFF